MERCDKCRGWSGEPRIPAVGEDVAFTFRKFNGRKASLHGRVGKLQAINGEGTYSVSYRKNMYRVAEVAAPDEPSPLTLAFCGTCTCNAEGQANE